MNFNQKNAQKWVQEGIEKETINAAFLDGWNFVCPHNKIQSLQTPVLVDGKNIPFENLSEKEKSIIVSKNKSDSLTTSQIRIAFGEMRKIQSNGYDLSSFLMLKPKLAYAVKRHDKKGLNEFYKIFSWAYDAVNTKDINEANRHFENFMLIMESLLAYHKYHGGKE